MHLLATSEHTPRGWEVWDGIAIPGPTFLFLPAREAAFWELEERHLQEKHQLLKQQLKDQYFMQRHQLLKRHEKVSVDFDTFSCVL